MGKIVIEGRKKEPVEVSLVGKDYEITPPKTALAMKIAVQAKVFEDDPSKVKEAIDGWVQKAFGKKVAKDIEKRLDDENDLLDFEDIMELMEALMEAGADGNPTS